MASAVVNMGPEPDMLARNRAAAQTVADRAMVKIIFKQLVLLYVSCVGRSRLWESRMSVPVSVVVRDLRHSTHCQGVFKRVYLTNQGYKEWTWRNFQSVV